MSSDALDRLTARIVHLERAITTASNQPQLAYSSIEDGSVDGYDADGNQVIQVGKQFDDTYTAVSLTGPKPPQPSPATVADAVAGLTVGWDGLFADPENVAPMDFARVDVHTSMTSGFDAIATQPKASLTSPRGGEVYVPLIDGVHYVALVARSESGKASSPSEERSGTSLRPATGGDGGTDGVPPAESPILTLLGGIGSLYARTTLIENPDPVQVDIYLSETTPVTLESSNLAATISNGGAVALRMRPDGEILQYDVPYYAVAVARDADGSAPPSEEITAELSRAQAGDLSPDAISVSVLQSGILDAEVILAGRLTIGESGQRTIELSPQDGIQMLDVDRTPRIQMPLDPDISAKIDADLIARSMTIMGQLAIRGVDNEVATGSGFQLSTGTTPPVSSPSITTGWESFVLPTSATYYGIARPAPGELYPDTYYVLGRDTESVFCARIGEDGVEQWRWNMYGADTEWKFYGLTVIGNYFYLLQQWYSRIHVLRFSRTGAEHVPWEFEYFRHGDSGYRPTIGTDGTNIVIAQRTSYGNIYVLRYSTTNGAAVGADIGPVTASGGNLAGLYWGPGDFGVNRIVVGSGNSFLTMATNGTYPVGGNWPTASGTNLAGLAWNDTEGCFKSLGRGGRLYTHTSDTDTTTSRWAGTTWRRANNIGPRYAEYESVMSPLTQVNKPSRSTMWVTSPPIPGNPGDPNSADSISVYVGSKSTQPEHGELHLAATPPTGQNTAQIDSFTTAGVNPPTGSNFPTTAAPAYFRSSAVDAYGNPRTIIRGDGTARLGPLQFGKVGDVADTADYWHTVGAAGEPAFTNGWRAYTGMYVKFRKDAFGTVYISGAIMNGNSTGNVFYVPEGYAPSVENWFIGVAQGQVPFRIVTLPTREIQVWGTLSAMKGWASLSFSYPTL